MGLNAPIADEHPLEGEKDYENNIFHAGHVHVSERGLMIG